MDFSPFLGKLVKITLYENYIHKFNSMFLKDFYSIKVFILDKNLNDNGLLKISSEKIKGSYNYWLIPPRYIKSIKLVKSIFI